MKKLFYYLLYPFNKLFDLVYGVCSDYEDGLIELDEHEVVYLVIGYYLDEDIYDICAVCDNHDLSEKFRYDLLKLGKYYKVSIVDFTLNQLNII